MAHSENKMKLKIGTRRKENAIICSMCSYSFWAKTSWKPRQRGEHEQSPTFVTRTEAGHSLVTLFLMLNSERNVCRDFRSPEEPLGLGGGMLQVVGRTFWGMMSSGSCWGWPEVDQERRTSRKGTSRCRHPRVRTHVTCLQKGITLSHRVSPLSSFAHVGTHKYLSDGESQREYE